MANPVPADSTWSDLAALPTAERAEAMETRFVALALLDEPERLDRIEGMVRAEFSLPEQALHDFTLARLQAWVALQIKDPAQAALVVSGYDVVMNRVPSDLAMRRASVVQGVVHAMSPEQITVLHALIPSLRQSVPVPSSGLSEERADVEAARARILAKKRPFWKIWA